MGSARHVFKSVAAEVLHRSGLRQAVCAVRRAQCGGRRVTIVNYHRVVADFASESLRSMPSLLVSQRTFRNHLEEAHASGYELASLDDALEVMAGRRRATRDLFVVTFDDGYRDVYRYAFPVLQQMGVPAVVYLATGYIGTSRRFIHDRLHHLVGQLQRTGARPATVAPALQRLIAPLGRAPGPAIASLIEQHPRSLLLEVVGAIEKLLGAERGDERLLPESGDALSWDEVRTMAAAGIAFGAHTVEHTVLTHEDPGTVDAEIRASREAIERQIERPVHHFAYCNGWYSESIIESLARHGFRSAATTEARQNQVGGDPYRLQRRVLWENFSRGLGGGYSSSLTRCHLDDVFGFFGTGEVVVGRRRQRTVTLAAQLPIAASVATAPPVAQPLAAVACSPADR